MAPGSSSFSVGGVLSGSMPNPGFASAPTFVAPVILTGAENTAVIASTGHSLTGSNASSMFDFAGTWNTSGTPTAFKLNITNTASNASSLLMDLQIGGTSQFKVARTGDVTATGFLAVAAAQFFSVVGRARLYGNSSGGGLDVRNSGGSAQAPVQASSLRITDGLTAPGATTGFATLYVDTADGDLKVVFADGTVKTIVVDT